MAGWGSVYYQYANNTGWKKLTAETDEYEKNGTTYPMYKIENVPSDVNWFNFTKNLVNGGANSEYYLNPSGEVENGHVFEITGPKSWTTSNISDWTGGSIDPTDPTDPTDTTTYTVTVSNDGNGKVQRNSSTVTSISNVASGTTITLTAVPNSGYEFDYWTVGGTKVSGGTATDDFTITANTTIKAYFKAESTGTTLYLDANDWDEAGALFMAHVYGGTANETYMMTDEDNDGVYSCDLTYDNHTGVVFVRKDPAYPNADWNGEWNRVEIALEDGKNCFQINGYSYGEWTTYTT